jgi:hypothetical protein
MFKAGTVAGLTSGQRLVQDIEKDVIKEGTSDHKERNNTTRSAQKLNGAHHGVRLLVEIQILHFLLLFFDIFSDSLWLKWEAHQFSAQLDRRCGLEKFHNFQHKS